MNLANNITVVRTCFTKIRPLSLEIMFTQIESHSPSTFYTRLRKYV